MTQTILRPQAVADEAEAVKSLTRALDVLDDQRQVLAHLYAQVPGNTTVEYEIGECLTALRKSIVRMRKTQEQLAQMGLPLE